MKYEKLTLANMYRNMLKIRKFEETVERYFLDGEIPGFVHLYIGEEAIAVGVCENLSQEDYIQSTHRGHGHTIAKGANIKGAMAEIFGKRTGLNKGKGGSMHIADFSMGMLGANGIVGGGFNLATGAALAIKIKKEDKVSVVFFGDGASNRGTFHEAANLASAWNLPVIFVCENNGWASTTPYMTQTSIEDISDRAQGYAMERLIVDGNDVLDVYDGFKKARQFVRDNNKPFFLEAKTLRIKGHFVGDPESYRSRDEVKEYFSNMDPIIRFRTTLIEEAWLTEEELQDLDREVDDLISEALNFAMESPDPDPEELYDDVYA